MIDFTRLKAGFTQKLYDNKDSLPQIFWENTPKDMVQDSFLLENFEIRKMRNLTLSGTITEVVGDYTLTLGSLRGRGTQEHYTQLSLLETLFPAGSEIVYNNYTLSITDLRLIEITTKESETHYITDVICFWQTAIKRGN